MLKISLVLLLGLCACKQGAEAQKYVDYKSFEYIGATLFSAPSQVTMKEVHLDKGLMFGREVMLEGSVEEVGSYQTYIVLSDKTARMLVVLTDVDFLESIDEEDLQGKELKVLGVVDYGKKGLPFIQAKSIVVTKKLV